MAHFLAKIDRSNMEILRHCECLSMRVSLLVICSVFACCVGVAYLFGQLGWKAALLGEDGSLPHLQHTRYLNAHHMLPDGAFASFMTSAAMNSFNSSRSTIILSVLKDGNSYGDDRDCAAFLAMIAELSRDLDSADMSLGLLVEDDTEIQALRSSVLVHLSFRRIVLIKSPLLNSTATALGNGEERHAVEAQRSRRRRLAQLRNFLVSVALSDESNILWLDADMIHVPQQLLPTMLASDRSILVPISTRNSALHDRCEPCLNAQYVRHKRMTLPTLHATPSPVGCTTNAGMSRTRSESLKVYVAL